MSTAVVCICSRNKGSLANAITHLASSLKNPELKLVLLSDNYATAPGPAHIDDVADLLDGLGCGKYFGRSISVDPKVAQRYRQAASLLRNAKESVESIYFHDFSSVLEKVTKGVRPDQLTIDITSLPKPLAADVTIACLFRSLRVHTFELTRNRPESDRNKPVSDRNKPEESMYHALPPEGFRYPCLTNPVTFEENMRRFVPKKALRVSTLVVGTISIACFALLIWLKPRSSAAVSLTMWIGLVASALGIGTAFLQLVGLKASRGGG